jgi:hypothetical protein
MGLMVCLLFLAPGCGGPDPLPQVLRERDEARDQLRKSREQEQAARDQLRQRDEQVATLQALGDGNRLEKLFTVQRVQIGGNSCGLGEANDPWDKGVKVYVEPLDRDGTSIKAAGDVTIEIFDLAAPQGHNLVHTCRFGVQESGGKWTLGFMSQFYLFECEWGRSVPAHRQVTIRVVFVDYLTGRTFSDQKLVEVALPPTAPGAATKPAATAPASASAPATAPATGP